MKEQKTIFVQMGINYHDIRDIDVCNYDFILKLIYELYFI